MLTMDGLLNAMTQQESSGRPMVEHPRSGAVGLMQIIPSQAAEGMRNDMPSLWQIATDLGFDIPDQSEETARSLLMDPVVNRAYGEEYMQSLLTKYNGDLNSAMTAYNAGPSLFDQVMSQNGAIGSMPEAEQRNYANDVREEFMRMYGFDMPDRAVLRSIVPQPRPSLLGAATEGGN